MCNAWQSCRCAGSGQPEISDRCAEHGNGLPASRRCRWRPSMPHAAFAPLLSPRSTMQPSRGGWRSPIRIWAGSGPQQRGLGFSIRTQIGLRNGVRALVNGNLILIQFFRHRQLNIDTPVRRVMDAADVVQSGKTSFPVDAFFAITPARRFSRNRKLSPWIGTTWAWCSNRSSMAAVSVASSAKV